jgi:hypothetical protein
MRFLGILLALISIPIFLSLLRNKPTRKWMFVALGALPIAHVALNLDAALISWAAWPGHAKGVIVSLLDTLALAICIKFGARQARAPLLWLFGMYLASLLPGLMTGLFQPAFFYFFQVLRISLLFYAVYLAIIGGNLQLMARGLSLALMYNAVVTVNQLISGAPQAAGLLGHQNSTGLAVNLAVPLLVALGAQKRDALCLLGVAVSALAGGSRATLVLYAVAVSATLLATAVLKPSPRKIGVVSAGLFLLLLSSPFIAAKLSERGGILIEDQERAAFERAAHMIIADYPWGVGINQYVPTANTQGYLGRAGVRWGQGARATSVHNTYLLIRAEGGLLALVGFLILLGVPLLIALRLSLDRRSPARDTSFAVAVAIAVTAIHAQYEWVTITIVPEYLLALMIGIVAAQLRHRRILKSARATHDFDLEVAGLRTSGLDQLDDQGGKPSQNHAPALDASPHSRQPLTSTHQNRRLIEGASGQDRLR